MTKHNFDHIVTLTVHVLINTDKSIIYFRFAFSSAKFHFSAESATRYLASTKVQAPSFSITDLETE